MKHNKKYLLAAVILLAVSVMFQFMARTSPIFGTWYASTVYQGIVASYGRLWGALPFSMSEYGLYALIVLAVWYGVRHRREAGRLISGTVFLAAVLFTLYTFNCGLNYYSRPFSSYLELEVKESSVEELYELCDYLTQKVNETVDETPYDGSWGKEAKRSMEALGAEYPQLSGYYPLPKAMTVSGILSMQQLCGIYSPFTVEANYNWEMPSYNIPHTMCHELSHLRGFMREDEANFIGYLACISSNSRPFRYSGYLTGWVYATNALADQDMERYWELYSRLAPEAMQALEENTEFWNQFDGRVAEVSNQLNDTYLKFNAQEDGVKSYGRAVDLMLAYYRDTDT